MGLGERHADFLSNNPKFKDLETHPGKENKRLGMNLVGDLGFSRSVVVIIECDAKIVKNG